MTTDIVLTDVQRWTSKRRTALVLSILKGEMSVTECARRYSLDVAEIESWQRRLLEAGRNALRSKPRDDDAAKHDEICRLRQKVGELVLDNDRLREELRNARAGLEPVED